MNLDSLLDRPTAIFHGSIIEPIEAACLKWKAILRLQRESKDSGKLTSSLAPASANRTDRPPAMTATCCTASILALVCFGYISCIPKPIPFYEPSATKALLYDLPIGLHWLIHFPHNSLLQPTTIEDCEREYWYRNRSCDLDKAYFKFKSLIQPKDVIWFWSGANGGMFTTYRGIDVPQGICLLRGNKIVAVLMTEMAAGIE